MIEIHLFEQLVTFASCGTLSAAAEQLQEFDRKRRTIFVAFCTPVLISDFVSLLSQVYEGMAISTEVSTDPEQTEAALREGKYHLAILYRKPDEAEFFSVPIESEHLYVSLPPFHPLADAEGLYLKDLDGQTFLLYSQIGFWDRLCLSILYHRLYHEAYREHLRPDRRPDPG